MINTAQSTRYTPPPHGSKGRYNWFVPQQEQTIVKSFSIELDTEKDGRWIAEIPELPGVMSYGDSKDHAIAAVKSLAFQVIADMLDNNELPSSVSTFQFFAPGEYA